VVQAQNRQLIEICNPNPNPKIAARDEGHLFPNFRPKKCSLVGKETKM